MPLPTTGLRANRSNRWPQEIVRSPMLVELNTALLDVRARRDEQRGHEDDRDAVHQDLVAVEGEVQQPDRESEHCPAHEAEEEADGEEWEGEEEQLAPEPLRLGQRHRKPDEDDQHQVEAERERQVERREGSQGEPGREPDVCRRTRSPMSAGTRGRRTAARCRRPRDDTHHHEDGDEVVALTPVERAAPDRECEQHAEVGEAQTGQRRVDVDEERGGEPHRDQDHQCAVPTRGTSGAPGRGPPGGQRNVSPRISDR